MPGIPPLADRWFTTRIPAISPERIAATRGLSAMPSAVRCRPVTSLSGTCGVVTRLGATGAHTTCLTASCRDDPITAGLIPMARERLSQQAGQPLAPRRSCRHGAIAMPSTSSRSYCEECSKGRDFAHEEPTVPRLRNPRINPLNVGLISAHRRNRAQRGQRRTLGGLTINDAARASA